MTTPPPLKAAHGHQFVVGIDPGVRGAIGVLSPKTAFMEVYDMPVIGTGRASEFDCDALWAIFTHLTKAYRRPLVRLEWPQTRPDEAAESSKRFGVGLGLLWGLSTAAGCEVERVAPNGWKGRLGLSGKASGAMEARRQAVEYAERVIPGLPEDAVRGPKGGLLDGRAEALLIAFEQVSRTATGLRAMDPHLREARVLMGGRGHGRRKK